MLRLVAFTLGSSALLLFVVQPMLGRALLPLLGGAPAVWTTVMLFFQAVLLAGYAYAHASARWLPWRAQVAVHLGLLGAGLVLLPFSTAGATPPVGDGLAPAWWLAGWLTLAVGLPVAALSASAPLLQSWTARAGERDPYALYAASNAGSLAALVGFPLVVEPLAGVTLQARGWATGYALLLILVAACAWAVRRAAAKAPVVDAPVVEAPIVDALAAAPEPIAHAPVDARRVARWLALAAVPVALLLGVTTHITTDLSGVPLLWVAPLAIYLLTFIITFERRDQGGGLITISSRALAVISSPLILVLATDSALPLWAALVLDLAVLFIAGLVCHGALARDRPPVAHLTGFYLCIAAGGVVGGLLCALVAPVVFDGVHEYPLAIAAACALRSPPADAPPPGSRARERALDLGWCVAVALVALGINGFIHAQWPALEGRYRLIMAFAPAAVLAHVASRFPVRHALTLVTLLACGRLVEGAQGRALHSERSFFGVLRVTLAPGGAHRWLIHGGTVHGAQAIDPVAARDPLVYYHRKGPCSTVTAAWRAGPSPRRVGVVGLGIGSLAAYAEPGETWTFYEIDPAVERLARDARYFTFLRDCRASSWSVVSGDARLRLGEVEEGTYGLLFLDAFSGDAIPTHLLTTEALALEMRAVAPGGLLAMHISNRYLELEPVVARAAAHLGLVSRARLDAAEDVPGYTTSHWVVLARREEDLGALRDDKRYRPLRADDEAPWTDDHAHVLGALATD